jgi:hypothetical protein
MSPLGTSGLSHVRWRHLRSVCVRWGQSSWRSPQSSSQTPETTWLLWNVFTTPHHHRYLSSENTTKTLLPVYSWDFGWYLAKRSEWCASVPTTLLPVYSWDFGWYLAKRSEWCASVPTTLLPVYSWDLGWYLGVDITGFKSSQSKDFSRKIVNNKGRNKFSFFRDPWPSGQRGALAFRS